jgi:penicillin-binding protein 1C
MTGPSRGLQPRVSAMTRKIIRFVRAHPRRSIALALTISFVTTGLWVRLGPIPADLLANPASASTVVLDRRGVPLYEALSSDGTRGVTLTAETLPPLLAAATIAAEDRRFRLHAGVDPIAVLRALEHDLAEHRIVEGGSTITQQVAKLLLNKRDPQRHRGVRAKIAEAVLAMRLEHRMSKDQILAMYLNLAGYGNQIAGAERASRAYFGREARTLTVAQSAFLAGLPQRPSGFNPYRSRAAAVARQRVVLARMEAAGVLTPQQAREAREERLSFASQESPFLAPHFVEMVLAVAGERRGARIHTTLDAQLQQDVTGIIRSNRTLLDQHGAANVAVVVLDNARGEWLAWEGSGDYGDTEHGGAINGPLTPRQPGSALKPFTYALAFEEGFTPATVLPDIPSHFPTAEQGVVYTPRNYDGKYRGPLLARHALAGSENVPAVALASEVGVPKLLRFLLRGGLSTFDRNASYYGLGVTLGNAEVRLDELVAAYAAFARGGEWIAPTWKLRPDANVERPARMLVSERTAFWITDILSDPDAREYIFGRGGSLEFPFPVAVKTGTSQAYHDNWTIGYTRDVTVGVWVGNFDRTPLRDSTGVTGAGPIFHSVMLAAHRHVTGAHEIIRDDEIVPAPADVSRREICALSGLAANPWCPARRYEWLPGDHTLLPCSWHHQADEGLLVIWPPEFRQWAKQNQLLADAAATPRGSLLRMKPRQTAGGAAQAVRVASRSATKRSDALEIVNPPAGAVYLIDPTLRRDFQTLAFKAVSDTPEAIRWTVDGLEVGASHSDGPLMWPLAPGAHRIAARDRRGRSAETSIIVR